MVRQFWLYMREADEPALFDAVARAAPGAVQVPGRFVRGDTARLLQGDLGGLEFGQHSSRETCRLIVHPKASQTLVLHPVLDGPLSGYSSVDVSFTDCLRWVRPVERNGWLEPARLMAETHVMRPDGKRRKTPGFTTWVGVVFRALRQAFPKSGVDFIHVAPAARAWVEAGQGQLGYLYQPVSLGPTPATVVTTPQKR
jgi:hypothetical protein